MPTSKEYTWEITGAKQIKHHTLHAPDGALVLRIIENNKPIDTKSILGGPDSYLVRDYDWSFYTPQEPTKFAHLLRGKKGLIHSHHNDRQPPIRVNEEHRANLVSILNEHLPTHPDAARLMNLLNRID